jgi:hypothetical protein
LLAEIRNQIYEHIFHDAHVNIREATIYARRSRRYQPACGILFACRKIRYEALPFFYAAALFDFEDFVNPFYVDSILGVGELYQVNLNARKAVQNISLPQLGMESMYSYTVFRTLECDLEKFRCLRGLFPALKHIHTT